MAIASFVVKNIVPLLGLLYAERSLSAKYASSHPVLQTTTISVPRLFGLVIIVNGVLCGFALIRLGFKVGAERQRCIEKAKKDGDDENAEERFSYPKIYAEGFSEAAKRFNCAQRGHQHALETYPMFLVLSLIGGLSHPITSTLGGFLWIVARNQWAAGYATGDPGARYSYSFWGRHIWTSLLLVTITATSTAFSLLSG